jgi:hypothetical protein
MRWGGRGCLKLSEIAWRHWWIVPKDIVFNTYPVGDSNSHVPRHIYPKGWASIVDNLRTSENIFEPEMKWHKKNGRGWEVRIRVNRKQEHSGHKNIVKILFVKGSIVFKFVKWVGNYVLIIHHTRYVLGTI